MKIVNKPIDMIATFNHESGNIILHRMKVLEDSGVEEVLVFDEKNTYLYETLRIAGEKVLCFKGQYESYGHIRLVEIRFYTKQAKWVLWKV